MMMTFSEYYAKMQASKAGCPHTKQSPSPAVSAREYNEVENHPRTSSSTSSSSSSSSWSTNPLMVTTIVALSIAVVATMVILPLVLCVQVRQRCTGKPAAGGTGARPQSAASPAAYDAVETGTMQPKLPSTPIYNPPNGLKEKSGRMALTIPSSPSTCAVSDCVWSVNHGNQSVNQSTLVVPLTRRITVDDRAFPLAAA